MTIEISTKSAGLILSTAIIILGILRQTHEKKWITYALLGCCFTFFIILMYRQQYMWAVIEMCIITIYHFIYLNDEQ